MSPKPYTREEIEAKRKWVEGAVDLEPFVGETERWLATVDACEQEIDATCEQTKHAANRAEKAEAEIERLREVLREALARMEQTFQRRGCPDCGALVQSSHSAGCKWVQEFAKIEAALAEGGKP